jgi:toxin FitB
MKLIDSNIIIYSFQPMHTHLRPLVVDNQNYVSKISKLEVLGYYNLSLAEKIYLENVFQILINIPVNDDIIETTIQLRQVYRIKSNDSIIAATALYYNLELYTRNVADFDQISELAVINPI